MLGVQIKKRVQVKKKKKVIAEDVLIPNRRTKKDFKKRIDKHIKKSYNINISYPNLLKGEIIYEKNGENNRTVDN